MSERVPEVGEIWKHNTVNAKFFITEIKVHQFRFIGIWHPLSGQVYPDYEIDLDILLEYFHKFRDY